MKCKKKSLVIINNFLSYQFPSDRVRRLNSLESSVLFWARISKSLHNVKSIKMGPSELPCVYRCWSDSC